MLEAALSILAAALVCAALAGWDTLRNGRRWPLVLLTFLAWSPVLSAAFTGLVAGALGCNVNEGFPVPCPGPFGLDLGGLLHAAGVFSLVVVVALPVIAGTALVWLALLGRWLLRRARRS